MDAISLKSRDLMEFPCISDTTYESNIYLLGDEVYKIFSSENDLEGARYSIEDLENKKKKIRHLFEMDLSKKFVKPLKEIYVDDQFRGYTMKYISNKILGQMYYKSRELRLHYLKEIKSIIEEAHQNNIILGDLNTGNFLVKDLNLYACDLDNSMIFEHEIDTYNQIAQKYIVVNGVDPNLDYFMFSLICIYMMSRKTPSVVLDEELMFRSRLMLNPQFRDFYFNFIKIKDPNYTCDDLIKFYENQKTFSLFRRK